MRTLILGIGNPILTDDGVGIRIAQKLKEEKPYLDTIETSGAGMDLLDLIVGYDRLIIVDSIITKKGKPGDLYRLELEDLKPMMNSSSSHSIDIVTAIKIGERLGYKLPESVSIYAGEIKDNTTFGERCTQEVEKRIPSIAKQIIRKEKL
jgi:hydrogenase maturation protease